MTTFFALLFQEIKLQTHHKTEWFSLLLFFTIVIILMPFALGPEPDTLCRLAPGLIWLAALLMNLLSLDRLFVQDAREGVLDEMLLSPLPLETIMFAKILAQALAALVVLSIIIYPSALILGMNIHAIPVLILTFLLGVPSLALLGGIAGAVTIALHRTAALLTLLLIPFYIPILIFAVGAADAAVTGENVMQPLLFLGALLALILPSAPFIIAASLRHGQG